MEDEWERCFIAMRCDALLKMRDEPRLNKRVLIAQFHIIPVQDHYTLESLRWRRSRRILRRAQQLQRVPASRHWVVLSVWHISHFRCVWLLAYRLRGNGVRGVNDLLWSCRAPSWPWATTAIPLLDSDTEEADSDGEGGQSNWSPVSTTRSSRVCLHSILK